MLVTTLMTPNEEHKGHFSLLLHSTQDHLPLGKPASSAKTAKAKAVKGVSSAGLTTTVQPAAKAAPAFLVIMAAGKFQGVIMAATPTGCLIKTNSLPLVGAGTTLKATRKKRGALEL